MKRFFSQIFQASNGNYSSKRFLGILSGVTLCTTLFINSFTDSVPAESLVNAVALLSFGCLGLTSADMIFKKSIDAKAEAHQADLDAESDNYDDSDVVTAKPCDNCTNRKCCKDVE